MLNIVPHPSVFGILICKTFVVVVVVVVVVSCGALHLCVSYAD
jgi:hypothetical protein